MFFEHSISIGEDSFRCVYLFKTETCTVRSIKTQLHVGLCRRVLKLSTPLSLAGYHFRLLQAITSVYRRLSLPFIAGNHFRLLQAITSVYCRLSLPFIAGYHFRLSQAITSVYRRLSRPFIAGDHFCLLQAITSVYCSYMRIFFFYQLLC